MTPPASAPPPVDRMEQLLCSLQGVVAARVQADPFGRPREIHVLAPSGYHPKQVVRNVESALRAGLGVEVDRRIVSVARVKDDAATNGTHAPPAAVPEPEPEDGADAPHRPAAFPPRLVFDGVETRSQAARQVECRVRLRRDDAVFTGTGTGPDTPRGRAEAGARATFAALADARDWGEVALEGVAIVDTHGRSYVHVAAQGLQGRDGVELTGTVVLDRSPEEAAVFAVLQATNRWAVVPS